MYHSYSLKILKYGGRPLSDYHLGRKPILQIFSSWLYSFQYEMKHEIDLAILRAGQFGLLSKWASEQQVGPQDLSEQFHILGCLKMNDNALM